MEERHRLCCRGVVQAGALSQEERNAALCLATGNLIALTFGSALKLSLSMLDPMLSLSMHEQMLRQSMLVLDLNHPD